MKVGDFVRSKANDHYGLVTAVGTNGAHTRVLWQGLACVTTWEFTEDLIPGVENELTIMRPSQ